MTRWALTTALALAALAGCCPARCRNDQRQEAPLLAAPPEFGSPPMAPIMTFYKFDRLKRAMDLLEAKGIPVAFSCFFGRNLSVPPASMGAALAALREDPQIGPTIPVEVK